MEHDVVLARKDGSTKHFRIYGRSRPKVGEIVTLPVDGELIKARTGDGDCVVLVEHIEVTEFEEV